MIVIIGLLVLIAAAVVAVAGVATNSGSAHPLGDNFAIFGQHLNGLSTGQLFLWGIVVGVVGMLGLSMLLGAFNLRLASRGARRALKGSRRESTALRLDRDRLTQQLDNERTGRRADTSSAAGASGAVETGQESAPVENTTPPDQSTAREPVPAQRSGIRERIRHHVGR
jgi:hypothetical protein